MVMQAIQVENYGPPEVMQLVERPTPTPAAGEALVRVAAAGVNFIDTYQRSGQYKVPLPFTPGQEAAGVIEAVGPGVSELAVGDRVAYASQLGSYAGLASVPARQLVPVPAGLELSLAAAVMLQGMTAHYLSHSTYPLKPGDTALVHAAGGGVGQLLVQLAKRRGARVIGTVSTDEKAALARAAGADEIIMYTQVDFAVETRRLTDGRGVDVVYDSVGRTTFDQSLNSLRPRGYLVLYGQSSGAVAPFDPQVLNAKGGLFLTRPSLGQYTATREELLERSGALFALIAAGQLTVHIDRTFGLGEAVAAHHYLANRQTRGKVLLLPSVSAV
jgi:NADPH2:quinone reductase